MILYLFLGITAGLIAGLIPGIHTNTISKIAFITPLFGKEAIVFAISMCTVQSFIDFIPTIFFGAGEEDSFESILPGHKLFLEGKAYEAICLTVFGGLIATIFSIIFLYFFIQFILFNNNLITKSIPIILLFSLGLLILSEKNNNKKLNAFFIIIAAATQGLLFTNQIFPLITGYFAIPTLLLANNTKQILQQQKVIIEKIKIKEAIHGTIGGAIVAIIPGIGNNLAAAIIKTFREKITPREYLVILGSINTSNFIFSLPMLFFLTKARNGTMLLLKEKIFFTTNEFLIGLITIIIASGIGGILTIFISKRISQFKINKRKIEILTIIFLIIIIFSFNGIFGLIALFFSSALGTYAIQKGVKRSNCLGFLIMPVLFFYLFFII